MYERNGHAPSWVRHTLVRQKYSSASCAQKPAGSWGGGQGSGEREGAAGGGILKGRAA